MSKIAWIVLAVVTVLIAVVAVVLVVMPSPERSSGPTPAPNPLPPPFSSENVKVENPLPSDRVDKTFTVRGEARGPWFFEANLPLLVKDLSGNTVGQGHATAIGEWMTTDFVPFEGTVTVDASFAGPARLVIMKDNASGLPENDDSVDLPIVVE